MSLYSLFKGRGPSGFGYGSSAEDVTDGVDLSGQRILITGCNSGIGLESMRVLSERGAHIVALARSVEKAEMAAASVGAEVTAVACELAKPESVRAAVETISGLDGGLDVMLCNAGIMALPKLEKAHGYELQFFTNHVGHFILVTGLLGSLSETGRVVMLSSAAHEAAPAAGIEFDNLKAEKSYSSIRAYGVSKLSNLLFARELATRLAAGQTANAVHPGVIATNLARHMNPVVRVGMTVVNPLVLKTVGQGAATQCYVAANPQTASVTGEYFADCNVAKSSRQGRDMFLAKQLWTKTEEIVAGL